MKKYLLGIILMAFGIVALTNGCGGPSPESIKKACFANQRVLLGAVLMNNLDNPDNPIKEFKQSMAMEGGVLVKERYLRGPIELPHKGCLYKSSTKVFTKDSMIICDQHGSYEDSY